jgi:phosphotransferase system enzyme I (PtsP)
LLFSPGEARRGSPSLGFASLRARLRLRSFAGPSPPRPPTLGRSALGTLKWVEHGHGGRGSPILDRATLLADVAEIVSSSHDLRETLDNVVEVVAKRLATDVCSVYLSEPDFQQLTLRATRGLKSDAIDRVQLAFGEGLAGLVVQKKEPIAIERAREHPSYRYFPESGEERFESFMAAPLLVRDVPIGVLVVQTQQPRRFERPDVELLQSCAQVIAPVVLNSTLLHLVTEPAERRSWFVSKLASSGLPISGLEASRREERNFELRGTAASRGIAIGPIHQLEDPVDLAHVDYVPSGDPERERADLRRALSEARRELDEVRDEVGERFAPEFAAVFNTHIQILEDHGFVEQLEEACKGNALEAVRKVVKDYRALFERIEDPYFRDRGIDIEDVGRRVMAKLLGVRQRNIPLSRASVLVTSEILPAAIVSEHGGATSHGAIFARTLEIPAVTGVTGLLAKARPGETAIVDGSSGRVYLSPDEQLLAEYRRAQHSYEVASQHLDVLSERPAETRDGFRIALTANVGLLADLRLVEKHGAEGIGLFRTELLALAHRGFPEEDEQEKLYERVASRLAPRPVTIRTLDLGGDKAMPSLGLAEEENPQLGWRSIRFSLAYDEAFRAQLRAILRASAYGNVRLLIPMVSCLDELRRVRELVEETKRELASRGVRFDAEIPVGIMIEVPSAALIADTLAHHCDFFSIGTNDLTQYTLAVDRGNEHVAHLYDPLHPAVLALTDRSARAASNAGIPVSVCGEVAGNPLAVPLLVGLRIGELSGTPAAVPIVKEIVRALDSSAVAEDARRALAAGTVGEVRAIAAARLRHAGLLDHPDIGGWLGTIVAGLEEA